MVNKKEIRKFILEERPLIRFGIEDLLVIVYAAGDLYAQALKESDPILKLALMTAAQKSLADFNLEMASRN